VVGPIRADRDRHGKDRRWHGRWARLVGQATAPSLRGWYLRARRDTCRRRQDPPQSLRARASLSPRFDHDPVGFLAPMHCEMELAMRNDQDLTKGGNLLVVPKLVPAVVLLGRIARGLRQHNRVDDRETVVRCTRGTTTNDGYIRVGREAARRNPNSQIRSEDAAAWGTFVPRRRITEAARAAWSGDPPAIA